MFPLRNSIASVIAALQSSSPPAAAPASFASSSRLPRLRRFAALGALAALTLAAGCNDVDSTAEPAAAPAAAPPDQEQSLVVRVPDARRKAPIAAGQLRHMYKNRINVKLRESTGIRPRAGALRAVAPVLRGADPQAGIAEIESLLRRTPRSAFVAMHDSVTEEELDAMKAGGELDTGRELPDLNLWTHLYVEVDSDEALAEIVNRLNDLDIVEVAEPSPVGVNATLIVGEDGQAHPPQPPPEDARAAWPSAEEMLPVAERPSFVGRQTPREAAPKRAASEIARASGVPQRVIAEPDSRARAERGSGPASDFLVAAAPSSEPLPPPPPAAGDYTASQLYKQAAPTGIDTDYLQGAYWNADGVNWGYTDIEFAWNQSHADLGAIQSSSALVFGSMAGSTQADEDHGTAVVGELSSSANGFGTTGMVPAAAVRLAGARGNVPGAITAAQSQFFAGTSVLIEQQYYGWFDCNGDNLVDGNDLFPVETDSATRDAIKVATANGRIVVEAAGNGYCDLDGANFNGKFSMDAANDSGAIIVGAAERDTRDRAWFSNYGARVDVQSEGDWKVTTTGYGDLYSAEGENRYYTSGFAGTSSASPIVTGATVALSSMLWFYNGSVYNPREIREVLRRDGTPQGSGRTGHIGPRPDMRKQSSHMTSRHLQVQSADFDGDGKADIAVFRPSNGTWYIWYSSNNTSAAIQFGTLGDIPVPADVSGDSRAELIVFRPSNGTWYIRSWDGSYRTVGWGTRGDTPIALDFDGNGKAQLAVVRPPAVGGTTYARWYILSQDEATYTWVDWGEFGDCPMSGDFDHDGRADLVQFRGTTGMWYFAYAAGGTASVQWGAWGDIPLTYRTPGGANIAVYRPGSSTFYKRDMTTGATSETVWGDYGDIPRFADTDGNGTEELMVYRPRNGGWYNLERWMLWYWGEAGDIAVTH